MPAEMPAHDPFLRAFLPVQDDLKAYLFAMLRHPQQVEAVFQEVAIVLWERFASYDPTRPFGAWARGVARNLVLRERDRWRQLVRLDPMALDRLEAGFAATEAGAEEHNERLQLLRRCLERLGAPARRLLELRYAEAKPMKALARQLRATVDSVTKRLSRLRSVLATCIARARGEDGV